MSVLEMEKHDEETADADAAARAADAAITAKINAWIIERMGTLPEVTHA